MADQNDATHRDPPWRIPQTQAGSRRTRRSRWQGWQTARLAVPLLIGDPYVAAMTSLQTTRAADAPVPAGEGAARRARSDHPSGPAVGADPARPGRHDDDRLGAD